MRDKKRSTRRRGPKHPLPDNSDSTYYTIDTTEEIYGTKLLPSQRCYIDPWDLENYDYVRKKVGTPVEMAPMETPSTPSPAGEPISSQFYYMQNDMDDSMMDYYTPPVDEQNIYNASRKFEEQFFDEEEQNFYSGYQDFESPSPSTEGNSLSGEESFSTLMLHTPGFGAVSRRRGFVVPKPAPKLEFPAPPPSFDYCVPDETGYCSVSDCYECLSQNYPSAGAIYGTAPSMIYGSTYGGSTMSGYGRKTSSIYGYSNKFGLSKKGLLQIDYSCSWYDLDRMIAKPIYE